MTDMNIKGVASREGLMRIALTDFKMFFPHFLLKETKKLSEM